MKLLNNKNLSAEIEKRKAKLEANKPAATKPAEPAEKVEKEGERK